MESLSIIGLAGFVFALIAFKQTQRLSKKMRDMHSILKANNLEGEMEMGSKAEHIKNYIGQNVRIFTYHNELALTDFKGTLESYEDGWVKVRRKNKIRLYKIEDIYFVEVID